MIRRSTISTVSPNKIRFQGLGMLLLVLLQFSFISLQAQFSERNTNCANPVVSADMFAANNINTICAGGRTSLRVNITGGQAPYRVVINTGTSDSVITNYTLGRNIIVQPVLTTVYTLKSVTDQTGCALSGLSDTTNIFVNAKPSTAIIYTRTSPASICSGSSTILQVRVFGGVSPFNIVYSDGVNNFSINNYTSRSNIVVNPTDTTTYRLVSVSNSNGVGCSAAYSSINTSFAPVLVSSPTQSGQIAGQSMVCSGSPVDLQLNNYTGNIQWQSSLNNIDFSNVTGANSAQLNASLLADSVFFRAIVSNGVCPSTQTTSFRVGVAQKGLWTGADNNDWHNPLNWSCGFIPDSSTHVVISPNSPNGNPIIGSDNAAAQDIELPLQSGIEIAEGKSLCLFGNLSGTGKVDSRFGKIDFSSKTSIQTISGSFFNNNTIKQLKVTNPFGISIGSFAGDTLKVTDNISFGTSNSQIITNNNLVLASTQTGTASLSDMTSDGFSTGVYSGNRIIGDVTVERFIPARKAWQFLAAPATGRTINSTWQEGNSAGTNTNPGYGIMLSSNNSSAISMGFDVHTPSAPSIKVYNIQTANWDGISSTFNNIDNNKGYMVFVRGDRSVVASSQTPTATTIRTTGKLYTPIDNPPSPVVVPSGKFESIGNPYASAIDFSKLNKTGGVLDAFYVWDPKLTNTNVSAYGFGGYQTFIGNGNGTYRVIPGGGSYDSINTNNVLGNIQSGQAFFVHATGVSGAVGFSESSKVDGSALVARGSAMQRMQLETKLSVINNNQKVLLDGVVTEYHDEFSNEIDANDIPKINVGVETISILSSSRQWVSERRKSVVVNDTIFYQLNQLKTKTYQLDIQPMMFENQNVQAKLIDRVTGTSTVINLNQSNSINFDVVANTTSAVANRFMIVLNTNAIVLPVKITNVRAERLKNNNSNISWKVEQEVNIASYQVERSTDGTKFELANVVSAGNATASKNYTVEDVEAPSSVCFYRIKAIENNGAVSYSSVVKVASVNVQGNVTVYPNPVKNKTANIQFSNKELGEYQLMVFNAIGQQVFTTSLSYKGQRNMKVSLPSNLQAGVYQLVVINATGSKDLISMVVE